MKPNILFILIDGLRSDRCYGKHKTSITPNIDSLITNGVYFEQAICSAPVTSPSMSSILTGLYPFESVILDNGIFMMNQEKENYVKILKNHGYSTNAIIPEATSLWGLDKIFVKSGFEWREPGCSMCLAMNADKLKPEERCASTSNRNFEGRQGRGGRTHLVSPGMAAAAAISGNLDDVRKYQN